MCLFEGSPEPQESETVWMGEGHKCLLPKPGSLSASHVICEVFKTMCKRKVHIDVTTMPGPSPGRGNVSGLEKVDRLAQLGRALGIEDHHSWGDQLPLPGREGSRRPHKLHREGWRGGAPGAGGGLH